MRKVGFCTVTQRVRVDAFDPGRLLDVLGMQWKEFCGLKRPANKFSELEFFAQKLEFDNGVFAQLSGFFH